MSGITEKNLNKAPYPGVKGKDEQLGQVDKREILLEGGRHRLILVCDIPYKTSSWFFEKFVNMFAPTSNK